jgi:hypothetical protein
VKSAFGTTLIFSLVLGLWFSVGYLNGYSDGESTALSNEILEELRRLRLEQESSVTPDSASSPAVS